MLNAMSLTAFPRRARAVRVLFVASECAPYAKCGGLADVAASLPKALRRLGIDARVVLPLYRGIDRGRFGLHPGGSLDVEVGTGEHLGCAVWDAVADGGVPVSFIERNDFFDRAGIYNDPGGEGYADEAWRYGYLCLAALRLCEARNWHPDVAHAHDWPTAILASILAARRLSGGAFSDVRTVLTIHNEAYQGYSPADVLPFLGIPPALYTPAALESYGQANFLKGGIVLADAVTTVSPTYAREILSEPGGCGLSQFLAAKEPGRFLGILNGADYDLWNPRMDPAIAVPYDLPSPADGKAACKAALQRELGLADAPDTPLYGMVCRLAAQKGISLLLDILEPLLAEMRLQLAILGSGDAADEAVLRAAADRHPGVLAVRIGYSNNLSHRIQAGSDFFLMPSLFEPCGLAQLYALRYGTLPIVHATGGLEDTVEQYNEGTGGGTGFKFYHASPRALHDVIGWANSTYFDRPRHLAAMRRRAMGKRFDWSTSAKRYAALYDELIAAPTPRPPVPSVQA